MRNIFKIGSPFMELLTHLANLMLLSLLWIVCCIPVVTVVPASVALYYVSLKMVRKVNYSICKDFFHSFIDNLKQGIVLNIVFLICIVLLSVNYFVFSSIQSSLSQVASAILLLLTISFLNTMLYTFPLQAQFANTVLGTLKNAFFMSIQRLPNTIIILLLNMLSVIFALIFPDAFLRIIPAWVLLAPAGTTYLCAIRFAKIFECYIPSPTNDAP